jgi:hypothetical protein
MVIVPISVNILFLTRRARVRRDVEPTAFWNTPEPDAWNELTGALKLVSLTAARTVTGKAFVLISDEQRNRRLAAPCLHPRFAKALRRDSWKLDAAL